MFQAACFCTVAEMRVGKLDSVKLVSPMWSSESYLASLKPIFSHLQNWNNSLKQFLKI